jgi:hypothetical protein
MSKIDFHGEGAGLGRIEKSGDANSAANYMLTCGCGLQLGPIGGYRPDAEGRRCIACPQCEMVTVTDKNAQILKFVAMKDIVEAQKTGSL